MKNKNMIETNLKRNRANGRAAAKLIPLFPEANPDREALVATEASPSKLSRRKASVVSETHSLLKSQTFCEPQSRQQAQNKHDPSLY